MTKKVLIISYYWPPSGGAGVQRWLKLSKYLVELGIEVHILAPKEESASYMSIDHSLEKDVSSKLNIHRTNSFEIINYYSKLVGKQNVPTAGFSNVDNSSFTQKLVNTIRSNFFIPDPRIGWKKYAVRKALKVINDYKIETIITTSPPHSTQIIGKTIKQKTGVNWIVDFRDPWTDIYYYRLLGHSTLSKKIDKKLERRVIEQCDRIITVSYGFQKLFLSKSNKISENKFEIIPNGFDKVDFKESIAKKLSNEEFIICYTGTISLQYEPFVLIDALEEINQEVNSTIKFRLIGIVDSEIKRRLNDVSFEVEYIDTVPHKEVHSYQLNCDLLLLVIPNIDLAEGITPGKLFEYLATKNQIIALGPLNSDVNRIIKECGSGATFERSMKPEIKAFLQNQIDTKKSGYKFTINESALNSYSRANQASKIADLL